MIRTGDIQNNIENLKRQLIQIGYPDKPDPKILKTGTPEIFLPVIHYTLFNYSQNVARHLSENNFDMFAKNDLDFINSAFKCLIKLFNYKPSLSTKQFFSDGFAEAKIILCNDIINLVKDKDKELSSSFSNIKQTKNRFRPGLNDNKNLIGKIDKSKGNKKGNTIPLKNDSITNTENKDSNTSNTLNNQTSNEYITNMNETTENNNISGSFGMNPNNPNYTNYNEYQEEGIPEGEEGDNNYQNENEGNYIEETTNENKNNYEEQISQNNLMEPTATNLSGATIKKFPNSSIHSSTFSSMQNCNPSGNNNDFTVLVQVISSLSNSVSQMANKIEKFKVNIEDRLSKVEAEIALIKNRQSLFEDKLNLNTDPIYNSNMNQNTKNSVATFKNSMMMDNKNNSEMNDQIFSFAMEENRNNSEQNMMNPNIVNDKSNYRAGGFSNPCGNMNNSDVVNNYESANFNYNIGMDRNDYGSNTMKKYEETDKLIENVTKKFNETRKLLNNFPGNPNS
ncbi:MAG: hypothetical protein MJ252_12080 [archaeon]|nr:hypothetical protein [archaeon]